MQKKLRCVAMPSEDLNSSDDWVQEALGMADLSPAEPDWGPQDAIDEIWQQISDAGVKPDEPIEVLQMILALAYAGIRSAGPAPQTTKG